MPGGFFVYRASDGVILYANHALLKILNCQTMAEFCAYTGNTFDGLVHPDDVEEVERSIQKQIARNEDAQDYVEYRVLPKGGGVRWVEDFGHYVETPGTGGIFYVFIADATEKRRLQREKIDSINREHMRRLEMIQGLSIDYDSLFYVDLDSNRILPYQAGSRIKDMFDGDDTETCSFTGFAANYVAAWVNPADRALVANALDPDVLRKRLINQRTYHLNYRAGRGTSEYLQFRFVNVGSMKHISQIVLGCRSVDEEIRHGLEQNKLLQNALSQAKAANAAKDVFLSNMSHDIRTPMNAIAGFTALAKNHLSDTQKTGKYLDMIESAGNRLLNLLDDVLQFSHLNTADGHVEETLCSLSELGRSLHASVLPRAEEKQISLLLDLEGLEHDMVYCDRYHLTLLLTRLAENAVKYTPAGGLATISFAEERASVEYAVYHFAVKDTGAGISQEFLPHIFEPFEREKNTTMSGVDGTGLGLTIAKSIVDLMGGKINVQSTPGNGSQFTVTLSLGLPHPDSEPEAFKPRKNGRRQDPHRILVVEDNAINLEIEMELLEDAGFLVDAAENGSIAIEKVRASRPGEYSLILMDLQMPVMDGYSAAQAIRGLKDPELSAIPIVALSANAFEEDRRRAVACGMNTHLPKPIDIAKLLRTIDELTGG
ncbi:MAG: response regulator [Oscillospiraceae bacterium]|nr:response regulator [Oscillospiraceae bacterium]